MTASNQIIELLRRTEGIVKLAPQYVHRFYPDLNRLGQHRLKRTAGQFMPERWIGSSVAAINPPPIPSGGLSMIADGKHAISLRDAIKIAPDQMLGAKLLEAHGAEFRVLVKILDPGEPIVFHFHATDAQVRRMPRNFVSHRFGKDEAYYFLDAPKGPIPYTHAGLHPGVTRRDLLDALKDGSEHLLELSPSFYQRRETGFFVPAGVPHRPGTALTLEIQQPSDVYALLEAQTGGKRLSQLQMHPGFSSLDEVLKLIELKLSREVSRLDQNRLMPRIESKTTGGEIATVFPAEVCRKFAGRRLRVWRSMHYRENSPYVLWVWKGRASINGRRMRLGDEFFVTFDTARRGIDVRNVGEELFEGFTFFPTVLQAP